MLLVGVVLAFVSDLIAFARGVESYADVWYRYFFVSLMVFASAVLFYSLDLRRTGALRFRRTSRGDDTRGMASAPTQPTTVLPAGGESAFAKTEVSLPDAAASEPGIEVVAQLEERPAEDLESQRWAAKLTQRLDEHRDYLEPDLKLADLAGRIGTNSSVLSRAVNSQFGVNFNDFINGKRCEAFLERVRRGEHERHTLLSLALDSGFNSKSTFNRAFRKRFGYSPGEALGRVRD